MPDHLRDPEADASGQDPHSRSASPMSYAEVTDGRFAAEATGFEALPTRGGVILRGACPRCGHVMDFPHVDRVYRSLLWRGAGRGARSAGRQSLVQMICTCSADHPGRPAGEDGCGAYWNLVVRPVQP